MCRACGARNFLREFSQAFRPGLTYAAPTALVLRAVTSRKPARRRRYIRRPQVRRNVRRKVNRRGTEDRGYDGLDGGGVSGEAEAADMFF
jgi:hypothetical protein